MKVRRDERNIYFYARTASVITPQAGANWMMLLIDVDQDAKTGWQGYDFIVNRQGVTDSQTLIEKNTGGLELGQSSRNSLSGQREGDAYRSTAGGVRA